MFWHVPGLSNASPVDTILDRENFKLEDLLDDDEIIQECKALNTRLINFLRDKVQVEQLLRYIVEEAPEDAETKRIFRFPFIACEIFTCEVDVIMKTLVEDEDLMDLLFSFLKPDHPHGTLLAGYFGKVVICLMLRKTLPLINYVQGHPEIVSQLVDLIGITSIMEVLVRLIGADETMYSSYVDSMQWLDDIKVLEMIVDKFSSSVRTKDYFWNLAFAVIHLPCLLLFQTILKSSHLMFVMNGAEKLLVNYIQFTLFYSGSKGVP